MGLILAKLLQKRIITSIATYHLPEISFNTNWSTPGMAFVQKIKNTTKKVEFHLHWHSTPSRPESWLLIFKVKKWRKLTRKSRTALLIVILKTFWQRSLINPTVTMKPFLRCSHKEFAFIDITYTITIRMKTLKIELLNKKTAKKRRKFCKVRWHEWMTKKKWN